MHLDVMPLGIQRALKREELTTMAFSISPDVQPTTREAICLLAHSKSGDRLGMSRVLDVLPMPHPCLFAHLRSAGGHLPEPIVAP
jgi:hypothetical protein